MVHSKPFCWNVACLTASIGLFHRDDAPIFIGAEQAAEDQINLNYVPRRRKGAFIDRAQHIHMLE